MHAEAATPLVNRCLVPSELHRHTVGETVARQVEELCPLEPFLQFQDQVEQDAQGVACIPVVGAPPLCCSERGCRNLSLRFARSWPVLHRAHAIQSPGMNNTESTSSSWQTSMLHLASRWRTSRRSRVQWWSMIAQSTPILCVRQHSLLEQAKKHLSAQGIHPLAVHSCPVEMQ